MAACTPQTQMPELSTNAVGEEGRRQRDMTVEEYLARLDRVDRVGWAIRTTNVDLCGERTAYLIGMDITDRKDFSKTLRWAAGRVAGVEERPTVFRLSDGGPAQAAGVRRGDVVLAVEGVEVATKGDAVKAFGKALELEKGGAPVGLAIEHDGIRKNVTLVPQKACAYPVSLVNDDVVNAYADGNGIFINKGILKFVKNDDELAIVVGHEMAHNVHGHRKAKNNNALLGALLVDVPLAILTGTNLKVGQQLGGSAFSQEFESEADYVGMYFMARAGFDYSDVAGFWRRMAVENPAGISIGSTHPSTSSRFVGLEAVRDEINRKKAEGKPLVPEMKK